MDCASELTALVSAEKTVGGRCLPNVVSPTRWECRTDDSSVRHDVLPAFARKFFARFQSRFVALLSMVQRSGARALQYNISDTLQLSTIKRC